MSAPRIKAEDVGAYFAGPDETLWKLVGYASDPTATLERVVPPPTPAETILGHRHLVGGVVGAPIFDGFVRLVLDGGLAEQVARCAYPGCRNEDVALVGCVGVGRDDAYENVFACPSHERWLRDDAGENLIKAAPA